MAMVSRKPHIVGKPFSRIEGQLKLTGASRYVADLDFGPDTLHACIVHSARPHARLVAVDVAAARRAPGVAAVLTGDDVPARTGMYLRDRPVLARERVRYSGEALAVVAAETPELARQAADLVRVTYDDLAPQFDAESSFGENAGRIHPDLAAYERTDFAQIGDGDNVAYHTCFQRGEQKTGWKQADVVVEHVYRVPPVNHVALEPHGAVAQMDEAGKILLWSSTQAPFVQRQLITQALSLDPEQLRVRTPCVGGGFGGKALVSVEVLAVALAQALPGRPVKLVLNRAEEFTNTFLRPGLVARVKMGARRDGYLTAMAIEYLWDCGASADAVIEMAWAAAIAGTGPYEVANVRIDSRCIYTNHPPAGPMRGHGMAEVHWAVEQHIDRMAEAVGADPVRFRLKNCLKGGDALFGGRVMHANGLDQCIRRAAKAVNWSAPAKPPGDSTKRRGKGLAAMWKPVVVGDHAEATASVCLGEDGLILLEAGAVDVGQGFDTVAVQLAASALSVPVEWVRLAPVDTDTSPFQWQALNSHLTWSVGNAILRAAQNAKAAMLTVVAAAWQEPVGNLDIIDGDVISYASERLLPLPELLRDGIETETGPVRGPFKGEGAFTPAQPATASDPTARHISHFSTGAQAVEIEVDIETGMIDVLQVASAFDVGHAINPDIVAAQIKGGAIQGLSIALLERMIFDQGVPQTTNLHDYRIASIRDLPARVKSIIVEVPQDDGPYGARGIGEHSLIPMAAAIAGALADAAGVRLSSLPLSNERVWATLQAVNRGGGEF